MKAIDDQTHPTSAGKPSASVPDMWPLNRHQRARARRLWHGLPWSRRFLPQLERQRRRRKQNLLALIVGGSVPAGWQTAQRKASNCFARPGGKRHDREHPVSAAAGAPPHTTSPVCAGNLAEVPAVRRAYQIAFSNIAPLSRLVGAAPV